MNSYQKMLFNAETKLRADMKADVSHDSANSPSRLATAGMALVELLFLFAAFKARDFQASPTPENLTAWCNAKELTYEPYRNRKETAT